MFDSYGDGICCGYGNGSYKLFLDDVEKYSSDGQFGGSESLSLPDFAILAADDITSTIQCADDGKWFYTNGIHKHDCDYLRQKPNKCNRTGDDGRPGYKACACACGM